MLKTTRLREDGVCAPFWSTQEADLSPVDPRTDLLMHFDGANNSTTFTDSSIYRRTPIVTGSPVISTAQSKFGGASGYFNNNGYMDVPMTQIGYQDYTIELWVYLTSTANQFWIDTTISDDHNGILFGALNGRFVAYHIGGVDWNLSNSISANTWYHVAFVRQGTTAYYFINGLLAGSRDHTGNLLSTNCRIGAHNSGNYKFHGYIDELRLSVGIARYTAAFTPSAAPFTR